MRVKQSTLKGVLKKKKNYHIYVHIFDGIVEHVMLIKIVYTRRQGTMFKFANRLYSDVIFDKPAEIIKKYIVGLIK